MRKRIGDFLQFPQVIVLAVLLAAALLIPSLRAGFISDDYIELAILEGKHLDNGPLDLFTLFPIYQVEIDEIGPTRVSYNFDRPLEDTFLLFLSWKKGYLEHIIPPPIGASIALVNR